MKYVKKLEEQIKRVHKQARDTLLSAQRRQKKDYYLKVLERKYNVGDLVYLINSSSKVGQSNKLKPIWKGTYLVIKVISPVLFKIKGHKRLLCIMTGSSLVWTGQFLCGCAASDTVCWTWMKRCRTRRMMTS